MTDYDIRWDAENPRWTYLKVTDRDEPEWSGWSLSPDEGDTPENLERDAAAFLAAAAWLRDEQRRTPGTDAHAAWVESERAAGRAHAAKKNRYHFHFPTLPPPITSANSGTINLYMGGTVASERKPFDFNKK